MTLIQVVFFYFNNELGGVFLSHSDLGGVSICNDDHNPGGVFLSHSDLGGVFYL